MDNEKMVDAFIGIDGPMMVMGTYQEVTGKDPVTEDGQQTEDFTSWWMNEVNYCCWIGITDPMMAVRTINGISRHNIVEGILDELWDHLINKLDDAKIVYDSSSGDAVLYYNDTRLKKTFAVHINQTECEEYERE